MAVIAITYDPIEQLGRLHLAGEPRSGIWERFRAISLEDGDGRELRTGELILSWPSVLGLLREYGSRQQQDAFGIRFRPEGEAKVLIAKFVEDVRHARTARSQLQLKTTAEDIQQRLESFGFTASKRRLREFQMRDVLRLLSLEHGANFSVPGAGKTTVTFALHLLLQRPGHQLLVICPKSAYSAWMQVVGECIDPTSPNASTEPFIVLDGSITENAEALNTSHSRFIMSYDMMIRQGRLIASHMARRPIHIVLDESHRMKAGHDSLRGAFLLDIAPQASRRDILTGTPMPQGPTDLSSQLDFLWPGLGLGGEINRGLEPRAVLGNLYVRTTKRELRLPPATRHFIDVEMQPGQQALYAIVRNETLNRLSAAVHRRSTKIDFVAARRSVMRLLQLSANPILAVKRITDESGTPSSGIIDAVLDEGLSSKMRAVVDKARELARAGRKSVIWTIFTESLLELEVQLADLNPVSIYGAVPSGSATEAVTREGRLARFHGDPACWVLIGNPAAAGEGISLHTVCHDAIYLDRSYVSTHYLQSIDRIHRLGLPSDVQTNIYIYRTKAPAELGSIDYSVSRRLAKKIRALEQLLDDPDLHEIALDEENADDPVDYSVDLQDLVDLIEELEGAATETETAEELG